MKVFDKIVAALFAVLVVSALSAISLTSMKAHQSENIQIISREEGSGTRGAFVELFEVFEKINNKKIDKIDQKAEITNSTAVMITSVANNESAIGYISLGTLNNSVKALLIDDIRPSVANIKNKEYTIARPFNVVTIKENALINDFLNFTNSLQAQEIITKAGYIPYESKEYTLTKPSGKIVIAGSSSISPLIEKLKEAYLKENKNATIEIQQSDSSTGINLTLQGIADIGMVSRELSQSELAKGLNTHILAIDGIAIIVNVKNKINNLSKAQIKAIFEGKITKWSELK
ncbi:MULTISPECIES: substrate-binding domain-containing protein [unclassified Campylobacter]|uniref:substrate-binding domain-containing protein n=1 Tax=unclassified Campylobacter TaxID=2593542 RepID=UPI001237A513|nr:MULTISPECIES: substrate-binding domain-containing protein [unclassified Campylobacter]KAA6225105.1 phosphate ABC transporter substrate-binding protein [Campylobacter sp. LR196d]KAA6228066.1 phosphate ABC transporter substrate-binding protein [Campylobacter sp. LR286c]KAA6231319.1 phosphate ABC transporter substrate-binding protein [Campylobacter sp. LR264d]KAA6231531.1 phosphate ABC transporter substrate-binding protein [Campylobacter sp. LR291e]